MLKYPQKCAPAVHTSVDICCQLMMIEACANFSNTPPVTNESLCGVKKVVLDVLVIAVASGMVKVK